MLQCARSHPCHLIGFFIYFSCGPHSLLPGITRWLVLWPCCWRGAGRLPGTCLASAPHTLSSACRNESIHGHLLWAPHCALHGSHVAQVREQSSAGELPWPPSSYFFCAVGLFIYLFFRRFGGLRFSLCFEMMGFIVLQPVVISTYTISPDVPKFVRGSSQTGNFKRIHLDIIRI